MECRECHVLKLPNEFSPEPISEECEHPNLFCLRCTIRLVRETSKCPEPSCKQTAQLSDQKIQWFQAILQDMFKEYDSGVPDIDDNTPPNPLLVDGILTVTVLTGESMTLPYNPIMEVLELKTKIKEVWNHDVEKQRLLFCERELENYGSNDERAKLLEFGIKPNSTICLVILLFAVPEHFNHVVFDLYWGYPSNGRDYLDASCLLFKGKEHTATCDYNHRKPIPAVYHSGDVMNNKNKTGHHTIKVKLKEIPGTISSLFFVLSAFSSSNISQFPNPSLKFYEASNPSKDLCTTSFSHANHSQAVVMCSVTRGPSSGWKIFRSGALSSGNAKNYDPLLKTVTSLISQGI